MHQRTLFRNSGPQTALHHLGCFIDRAAGPYLWLAWRSESRHPLTMQTGRGGSSSTGTLGGWYFWGQRQPDIGCAAQTLGGGEPDESSDGAPTRRVARDTVSVRVSTALFGDEYPSGFRRNDQSGDRLNCAWVRNESWRSIQNCRSTVLKRAVPRIAMSLPMAGACWWA